MPMHFCFYSTREQSCANVGHCPHLGGAAIGTLVGIAHSSGDTSDRLHRLIAAERKRKAKLVEENRQLEKALEQAKLELKRERQHQFATHPQQEEGNAEQEASAATGPCMPTKRIGRPMACGLTFRRKSFNRNAIGVRVGVEIPDRTVSL